MPMSCNLFSTISWFMLLNALVISNNTTAVTFSVYVARSLRSLKPFIYLQSLITKEAGKIT